MATMKEFYDTRRYFIQTLDYKKPLSYDEWRAKPEDLKAAFLYVQFFNEITLAWDKADAFDFADPEEGVYTTMQYLQKQVSQNQYVLKSDPSKKANAEFRRKHPDDVMIKERRIIDENPKKFSSAYIYRVIYNCLYCICHDRKCDKDRWENEISSYAYSDGTEVSLFDFIPDKSGSAQNRMEANIFEREFWQVVQDMGQTAEKVMRYLLSGDGADLKKLSPSCDYYSTDPLADVEVSLEEVEEIVNKIRERFLDLPQCSACGEYILRFQSLTA